MPARSQSRFSSFSQHETSGQPIPTLKPLPRHFPLFNSFVQLLSPYVHSLGLIIMVLIKDANWIRDTQVNEKEIEEDDANDGEEEDDDGNGEGGESSEEEEVEVFLDKMMEKGFAKVMKAVRQMDKKVVGKLSNLETKMQNFLAGPGMTVRAEGGNPKTGFILNSTPPLDTPFEVPGGSVTDVGKNKNDKAVSEDGEEKKEEENEEDVGDKIEEKEEKKRGEKEKKRKEIEEKKNKDKKEKKKQKVDNKLG